MARARRRAAREEIPLAEPLDEGADTGRRGRGRGGDRAPRVSKGPSFALPLAFGAAICAGILAFLGSLSVAQMGGSDPSETMDMSGIAAVRMLTAVDIDRWNKEFGTTAGIYQRLQDAIKAERGKVAQSGDDRDLTVFNDAVAQWMDGTFEHDSPFVPGFKKLFGEGDLVDLEIQNARSLGLKAAFEGDAGALAGAMIQDASGKTVIAKGKPYLPEGGPTRTFGDTKVYRLSAEGRPLRLYEHPMRDRKGNMRGRAIVGLYADLGQGPDLAAAAGAAAAGAFLGALVIAFFMAIAPVKALQRLAAETDNLARGDLGGRVTTRGPKEVQIIAKNVQRIAALAAEGGGEGATQIVTERVMVAPTEAIQAGLAPSRGFQRPKELEIESTTKGSPESGNDYHDLVNVDDEHVGFLVADIPANGLEAAFYMSQLRAHFQSAAKGNPSPADVLKQVNRSFAAGLPRGVYVTAMYAVVNTSTGVCKVASAQHLPMIFWKLAKKASARLQPEGIALGLDAGPVFDKTLVDKAIQLDKGDRIVLFTDGAINAKNPQGVSYGEERFYYVVNREAPKNSAAFVNFVANDVDLFHEGATQTDDFTIVTARRVG